MGVIFREGFRKPAGVDPEQVAESLDEIHSEHGELTPAAVVEAAEPKDSALHPFFEWRNSVAARKHREWQARMLIRSVRVVDASGRQAPAYVSCVRVNDEGVGRPVYDRPEIIVNRPDEWLSALELFNAKLTSVRASLEELEVYAGKHEDHDRLSRIAIAAKALDTARAALSS